MPKENIVELRNPQGLGRNKAWADNEIGRGMWGKNKNQLYTQTHGKF
jgi:hypothetical protein